MALTSGQKFMSFGLSGPQAVELVSQIAGTGDARRLGALGFPISQAKEIAAQIEAGGTAPTNALGRLVALGTGPELAQLIVAEIAAANA